MKIGQGRRDWVVYAILNCLPWVGRELYDKKQQTMERLMITIDNYMKKRSKRHHALLRVWLTDDPHPQEEVAYSIQKKGQIIFTKSLFHFTFLSIWIVCGHRLKSSKWMRGTRSTLFDHIWLLTMFSVKLFNMLCHKLCFHTKARQFIRFHLWFFVCLTTQIVLK